MFYTTGVATTGSAGASLSGRGLPIQDAAYLLGEFIEVERFLDKPAASSLQNIGGLLVQTVTA